ncbi:hypothetical protein FHR83_003556 [Actinoplanes campanulatus]|uniref:Uncharacterized protein n=1 Tax=Actinoplanes campanulatus TaxID=113559 RepID=A0A7W5AGZ3_9ACTN|nr:hypothetical protein [Actinoplanes campanulatus]MBB3095886.1 hypothetical protein [Actinoplanes campanulatus]
MRVRRAGQLEQPAGHPVLLEDPAGRAPNLAADLVRGCRGLDGWHSGY